MANNFENSVVDDTINSEKKGERVIAGEKSAEGNAQEIATIKATREKFLKSQGIELLSREEMAKMSLGEVTSYQVDMRNKLLEAQNSLPSNDFEASRVIFDEALSEVNTVSNPSDYSRLREEFEAVNKK